MSTPRVCVQVVDDVARAENEDALAAQRIEAASKVEVLFGGQRLIDAELDDRNIGFGKQMHEKGPGAVVEAPILVQDRLRRREQRADAPGELR